MNFIADNFIEERFPTDISFGAYGGPEYSTQVSMSISGREKRNINWQAARHRYHIDFIAKRKRELDLLLNFFHNCQGRAIGFRFKDWNDYQAKGEKLIRLSKEEFYLNKTYIMGGYVVNRPITKPVKDTVKLNISEANYEIDYQTGRVKFEHPPPGGVMADFEFDVPVRFDIDKLDICLENDGLYTVSNINLIEVRI